MDKALAVPVVQIVVQVELKPIQVAAAAVVDVLEAPILVQDLSELLEQVANMVAVVVGTVLMRLICCRCNWCSPYRVAWQYTQIPLNLCRISIKG